MRTRFAVKRTAIYLLMLAAVLALCSCRVSGKSDLIRYAKSNYGDCEFIRQDHNGSGKDEVRTVYLKDKETGIEYSVTSSMSSIVIDGSVFGHQEYKSSDFDMKYQAYLLDKADSGLRDLAEEYGFSFDPEYGIYKLNFDSRESGENAKKAVKEVDKLLAKYDTKNLRPMNYLLYVEDNVYIGTYDASTGEYTKSNEFDIIDYVHENYDPEAVFLDSLGAYINEFLSYEEIDELFPSERDGVPMGTAYYFRNKDGEIFIAIDLDEFGANASGIRLFRDYSRGMEEIEY